MRASQMRMPSRWICRVIFLPVLLAGCGSEQKQSNKDFFTSGSHEADQRADQRMAKAQQLKGEGGSEKPKEEERSLYQRLGGQPGIAAICDDFVARAMADPRVNWERKGVVRGGFSFHHNQSMEWKHTDAEIARLKLHLAQFIAVATGGPSEYQGQAMKGAHTNMHISNPEFDASVGDFKASLDKLAVPNKEQKELLAIVESTRAEIVEER